MFVLSILLFFIYIYDIWFQVTDDRLVSNSNLFKLQVNQPADWSPEDLEKLEQVASSMPQHATACRSMTASIQLPFPLREDAFLSFWCMFPFKHHQFHQISMSWIHDIQGRYA